MTLCLTLGRSLTWICICSALSAASMDGRRTMRSSGYVLPYQIACEVCILIVVSLFQYDPIDREGIECPPATQNKDGVYQCKKHGSSGTLYYLISSLPSATDQLCRHRLQPVLRLEEADKSRTHCCEEGWEEIDLFCDSCIWRSGRVLNFN